MSRTKVALEGATGKMGKALQELLHNDPAVREDFMLVEKDKAHVLIDFSAPEASLAAAKFCAQKNIPHLVCTTGFNPTELKKLEKTHRSSAWALVPNTSLGIFTLGEVLKQAVKLLPKSYAVSVVEIHHAAKKDAPSGTGQYLERILADFGDRVDVPVLSLRGGTEPGEHRVIFLGPAERLEFLHRAESRSLFAHGALRLAKNLQKKKARAKAYSLGELL